MTTAYLTHDDVNAYVAQKLAARLGVVVAVLDVRQSDPAAVRIVCDLDHLPDSVKEELLLNAAGNVDLSAVAVHSYNLLPAEVRALRAAGATVARRLTRGLLACGRPHATGDGPARV